MSGEIVRWKPPVSDLTRRIDAALEQRGREAIARPPQRAEQDPSYIFAHQVVSADDVLDVMRICAVHDRPYASRYIRGQDYRFHYHGPIEITKSLYRLQYEDSPDRRMLPNRDIDHEQCAYCGATGLGAVLCGRCKALVCYGKAVRKIFRCRPSCGEEGPIVLGRFDNPGISPFIQRR